MPSALAQASLTDVLSIQALRPQVFSILSSLIQVILSDVTLALLVQAIQISILLETNPSGYKKLANSLKLVNILSAYGDGDTDVQLSKYPAFRQEKITRPLVEDVSKVVTLKKIVTSNKIVAIKEISMNQLLNPNIMKEIQIVGMNKADKQSYLIEQVYNKKDKNLMLTQLLTKQLHDMLEASTNLFASYHLHHNNKCVGNLTWNFAYNTKPGLATKIEKQSRTAFHLFFFTLKPPSLVFSLSHSKYASISKCATISKQKLTLTLTSFFLLFNYLSNQLTSQKLVKTIENCKYFTSIQNQSDASFDLYSPNLTAKFFLNTDTVQLIGHVIYSLHLTNKVNKLF